MTTLIKCCGMFRPEDIVAVNDARPDFCGFVVNFPKSHRNVTPEQARQLRMQLESDIAAVGVFVNVPTPRELVRMAAKCAFDAVQLHGDEDEAYIAGIRDYSNVTVIKAFKVRTPHDLEAARTSSADYVLLDNGKGTGEAFDWELLAGFARPYFLAGGLAPESIAQTIERLHPYAIDISSGLETNKVKDPAKILAATHAARAAGATRAASETRRAR